MKMIACHRCGVPYDTDIHGFTCPHCERNRVIIESEVDAAKFYNGYKYDPKKASHLVDAATYGYRYVQQNQGSAFHKACELSKKLKKYDCSGGWAYYDNEPIFLNKKLNIPEYKGEMNMKNVSIEEKQTLRICRECNEWRDIYTVADTEPTDLFALCGDPNMNVYMRVAMDEDTFLIKDPKMVPVMDVKTGHIDMMDTDEKIFIYDPRGCRLGVSGFMDNKPHDDRY